MLAIELMSLRIGIRNIPSTGSYDWSKVKFRESIAMLYSYTDE